MVIHIVPHGRGRTCIGMSIIGNRTCCSAIELRGFRYLEFVSRCHVVCRMAVPHRCRHFIVSCRTVTTPCCLAPLCSRRTSLRFCLFGYFVAFDYVSGQHSTGTVRARLFTLCPARGSVATCLSALSGQGFFCRLSASAGF